MLFLKLCRYSLGAWGQMKGAPSFDLSFSFFKNLISTTLPGTHTRCNMFPMNNYVRCLVQELLIKKIPIYYLSIRQAIASADRNVGKGELASLGSKTHLISD